MISILLPIGSSAEVEASFPAFGTVVAVHGSDCCHTMMRLSDGISLLSPEKRLLLYTRTLQHVCVPGEKRLAFRRHRQFHDRRKD